jgi:hypothetical protein
MRRLASRSFDRRWGMKKKTVATGKAKYLDDFHRARLGRDDVYHPEKGMSTTIPLPRLVFAGTIWTRE